MRRVSPLIALALAACGGDDGTSTAPRGGGAAPVAAGAGGTWPADAPAHAPPYPGARITGATRAVSNGVIGSRLGFETDDSPTAVVAFYKARAERAGLPEVATLTNDTTALYSAGAASGPRINVEASAAGGTTMVALTFSGRPA
ncbi:MAG: hypothetical protein DCF31_15570 [Alphaproteobacteria bacterium]|nr:MAG: hypothetical protein DCF31_15570 [Alphaproteobacteria bacterium]